jgi:hypothetical protein
VRCRVLTREPLRDTGYRKSPREFALHAGGQCAWIASVNSLEHELIDVKTHAHQVHFRL